MSCSAPADSSADVRHALLVELAGAHAAGRPPSCDVSDVGSPAPGAHGGAAAPRQAHMEQQQLPGAAAPPASSLPEAAQLSAAAASAGVAASPGRYADLVTALRMDNQELSAALLAAEGRAQQLSRALAASRAAEAASGAAAAAAWAAQAQAETAARRAQGAAAAARGEAARQARCGDAAEARLSEARAGLEAASASLHEVGGGTSWKWGAARARLAAVATEGWRRQRVHARPIRWRL
jgi:hypothetical protein